MKTDAQLKSEVTAELAWDPRINAANIGIAVREGIVSLSGQVDTYIQKHAVEKATRRIAGNSSCNISRRFPPISGTIKLSPVTLPPGRAKEATNPFPTGSASDAITIGIVLVAFLAARVTSVPSVTMI